jgi:hypothetical protein
MNSVLIFQILSALPALINSIEGLVTAKGQGAAKLAAVTEAITPMIPVEHQAVVVPQIQGWVSALIAMYKIFGFFTGGGKTVPALDAASALPSSVPPASVTLSATVQQDANPNPNQ